MLGSLHTETSSVRHVCGKFAGISPFLLCTLNEAQDTDNRKHMEGLKGTITCEVGIVEPKGI